VKSEASTPSKTRTGRTGPCHTWRSRVLDFFYFALNPDSADTGGLVMEDWSVPKEGSLERAKLQALSIFPSTSVWDVCPKCNASDTLDGGVRAQTGSGYGIAALLVFLFITVGLCAFNIHSMYRTFKANRHERLLKRPIVLPTGTKGKTGQPLAKKGPSEAVREKKGSSACAAGSEVEKESLMTEESSQAEQGRLPRPKSSGHAAVEASRAEIDVDAAALMKRVKSSKKPQPKAAGEGQLVVFGTKSKQGRCDNSSDSDDAGALCEAARKRSLSGSAKQGKCNVVVFGRSSIGESAADPPRKETQGAPSVKGSPTVRRSSSDGLAHADFD